MPGRGRSFTAVPGVVVTIRYGWLGRIRAVEATMPKRKIKVTFEESEARALLNQVWTMSTSAENYREVMGAITKLREALKPVSLTVP